MSSITNSHANQASLMAPVATNVSLTLMQNPNPSYLLAMANNLQSTAFALAHQELVVSLLKQAAKQGLAEAQFQLGNLYLDSEMLDQDEEQAIFWISKAADQNHVSAQFVYEQIMNNGFDIGC